MKYLITGGCGFVGSHLTELLLAKGHIVHVMDNFATGHNLPAAQLTNGDVRSLEAYPSEGFDVVFHLAALARIQPSFNNPVETYAVNSQGTFTALEFARRCGARFVYAGSSSVYHDVYANPYTYSKWLGEEHCKLYHRVFGLSTVIARFFNVYGPRHITDGPYATVIGIFERQWAAGQPLTITGNGEQRRDFTHVNDVVRGLEILGGRCHIGKHYNFGCGRNYSINEVAQLFGDEVQYIPARPGEAWTTLADIRETTAELGWSPQQLLADYIEEFKRGR